MKQVGPGVSALWALVAVVLVALNLRGPIAAVGPVLGPMTADLHLTPTTAGLLTTLPVLCFAGAAPLAAWVGRLLGPAPAIGWSLAILAGALVLRPVDGTAILLVGTVVAGVAMTFGNVLLPVVVKRDFESRTTSVMALYTSMLAGGAALTAATTAPLAAWLGWRAALAAGGVLAVLALGTWGLAFRAELGRPGPAGDDAQRPGRSTGSRRPVWRQSTAWAVALLLGFQSALYYALTSWLPLLLQEEAGLGTAGAGVALSLFQLLGIPGSLLVPLLARRRPTQSWLALLLAGGWGVMLAGLLAAPQVWLLWCAVGGVAQGVGIALAFSLVVLRSVDTSTARSLSAMGQMVGYAVGAGGPVLLGALRAGTGGWTWPLLFLGAAAVALAATGVVAGRDRPVVSAAG
ncbi:MFS transporter [Ornithinimicrobium tianjinense]|uniref:MFS transporter n=1 Tax=Ornithinimicrobium tianjinense TaxID=1195761 RepID=UPI001669A912|nr:MFS transporter [Ornithinimicrobium tianjinense]